MCSVLDTGVKRSHTTVIIEKLRIIALHLVAG
jgi:hypothetical protein